MRYCGLRLRQCRGVRPNGHYAQNRADTEVIMSIFPARKSVYSI